MPSLKTSFFKRDPHPKPKQQLSSASPSDQPSEPTKRARTGTMKLSGTRNFSHLVPPRVVLRYETHPFFNHSLINSLSLSRALVTVEVVSTGLGPVEWILCRRRMNLQRLTNNCNLFIWHSPRYLEAAGLLRYLMPLRQLRLWG
jgi:hypothetical protein